MRLIVGLGNPEKKYETTFHNMGFLAVGEAAEKLGVKFKKKECEASVAEAFLGGDKVILARPAEGETAHPRLGQRGHAQRHAQHHRRDRLAGVPAHPHRH